MSLILVYGVVSVSGYTYEVYCQNVPQGTKCCAAGNSGYQVCNAGGTSCTASGSYEWYNSNCPSINGDVTAYPYRSDAYDSGGQCSDTCEEGGWQSAYAYSASDDCYCGRT